MEIYAIFNSDTNVYQCALKQGAEPDGQFDVRGDERWQQQMASLNNLFGAPHVDDDWILIDEDDFEKYMLGRSGGDNGTGYIRDPETNHAVSAPAEEKTYEQEITEIQENYKAQTAEIKDDYLDAVLSNNDDGVAEAKTRYATVTEENDNAVREAIDKYFNDKGGD